MLFRSELHHYRGGGWGKGDYKTLIPLCLEHHRGNSGIHGLGTKGFDKFYPFTQKDLLNDALALVKPDVFGNDVIAPSLPKGAQTGWQEFVELIKALTEESTINNPTKQIEIILERGYNEYLQATFDNAEAREEDLKQLALFAGRYETTEQFLNEQIGRASCRERV